MDIETAIACINYLLIHQSSSGERLNDLEEEIIRGCWEGKSYKEIARESNRTDDRSYVSNCASHLWKDLSEALGETIKLNCLKNAINDWYEFGGKYKLESRLSFHRQKHEFLSLLNNKNYIYRHEEETCYRAITQNICLRLKGLTQVGKTVMIKRVISRLKEERNYNFVYLSLKEIETDRLNNFEDLIRWLAKKITKKLNYDYDLENYWQSQLLGVIVQCTNYLEDYILHNLEYPVILCIDDVHLLLPYPKIKDNFFQMLRSWLEKEDVVWRQNFRLAIIYTTDIYTSEEINHSPFNLGVVVDLSELNESEVENLIKIYPRIKPEQLSPKSITKLRYLVNDNPYLLTIALEYLSVYSNQTLLDLISTASTDVGIYQAHLRDLWLKLEQNPELEALFKKVIESGKKVKLKPHQSHFLQRMGLVKILPEGGVQPRCELYREYFSRYWS